MNDKPGPKLIIKCKNCDSDIPFEPEIVFGLTTPFNRQDDVFYLTCDNCGQTHPYTIDTTGIE